MTDLGEKADQLGHLLRRAEGKLGALGFGVRARIPLPDVGISPHFLGFGKIDDDTWRLTLERDDGAVGDTVVSLLLTAPREVRVKAAVLLPALEAELQRRASTDVADVDRAIAAVISYLRRRKGDEAMTEIEALRVIVENKDELIGKLKGRVTALEGIREDRNEWQDKCREETMRAEAAEAQRDEVVGALAQVLGIVSWMSGSNDFCEGGMARVGWIKSQPELESARAALAKIGDGK